MVYDFLIVLGVLILLLFVCRLWPILLLALLGLIAVVIKQLIVPLAGRQINVPDQMSVHPAGRQTTD